MFEKWIPADPTMPTKGGEVLFISDLHLHPQDLAIQARFDAFVDWVKVYAPQRLYILGDFFHAWAGDDAIEEWSASIAMKLRSLVQNGISLFYMSGNRDFLLGQRFAQLVGWQVLSEPSLIQLGDESVLLAHGDRYCIKDKAHQWFRTFTRNKLFSALFLSLPLRYRRHLVNQVRQMSSSNKKKPLSQMDVVAEAVLKEMAFYKTKFLIHGHTHQPGVTYYTQSFYTQSLAEQRRYVLSDWDDNPLALCYDKVKGLYFVHCP
jgi:UDP-2,3-diacylglucosamine hydrolase